MPPLELASQALHRSCDAAQFDFETTHDLEDLTEIIGRPRAVEAVKFGTGIQQDGYNIFAMGAAGTGKRSLVLQYFQRIAAHKALPSDWCYVHRFDHSHEPRAVRLPAGLGTSFQKDTAELIEDVRAALLSAFDSDQYRARQQEIEERLNDQQEQAINEIDKQAHKKGLTLMSTQDGMVFAPLKDEKVITPEEFEALPESEREHIEHDVAELRKELQHVLLQQPRWRRESREEMKELDRSVADQAIGALIDERRSRYAQCPEVVTYLDALRKDVIENVKYFLPNDDPSPEESDMPPWMEMVASQSDRTFFQRYQVNLIVTNSEQSGVPVIYEDNPTYQNLIGRVEYLAQMGGFTTDFTLIKPGALHKANGGYLVLEARKLLEEPFAWEGLKRALHSGCVRIESPQQMDGQLNAVSLEPEAIPLSLKVALLGDRSLYYLLYSLDPEFSELFKVVADFDEFIPRQPESELLYARLIGTLARKSNLRSFDRCAVARIIEQSSRMAEDAQKLTVHMRGIDDLLHEADYWASEAGHEIVSASDVQRAIDAQIYRADGIREQTLEYILRGTILIDTEGEKIGQVNGLSVVELGDFAFGHPTRITASARLGTGEVIDIEREVDLGGPIHSKGVLILAGFLGARYAADHPLSLAASLVFEQSYGGVEGDSASSAELYALLSAVSGLPLKQSLAVTGSVNQHGQVQAIGGVNEKIEGFFDICKTRGLTGAHGVMIPASNVENLMLRQDVIEAVKADKFHIYPVETIDQGLELLTGIPSGAPDAQGHYPQDTVNGKVAARLAEFARQRAAFRAMAER